MCVVDQLRELFRGMPIAVRDDECVVCAQQSMYAGRQADHVLVLRLYFRGGGHARTLRTQAVCRCCGLDAKEKYRESAYLYTRAEYNEARSALKVQRALMSDADRLLEALK